MQNRLIKGKVVRAIGEPQHHRFLIEDDEGNQYFAHVGDLQGNEDLVLQAANRDDLQEGDDVEFEPVSLDQPRAIHVRKAV